MNNRVVLLACGSFNPITNMHLRLFEVARDALSRKGLQIIAGVISPVNDSYGKQGLMPANHRCAMVELALQSSDWIRLDRWESEQKNWTETVKVLRRQRDLYKSSVATNSAAIVDHKEIPANTRKRKLSESSIDDADNSQVDNRLTDSVDSQAPVAIKLLCGADLLESFAVPGLWKEADMEEIVSQFGIVCISRQGFDAEKFIYENDMLWRHRDNIFIVTEHIYNEISATRIRRALRRRESVKYLIQDSVIDYINSHHLYEDTK